MKTVRVCGQCCVPTDGDEYGCPSGNCNLVLCATCSNPEVHFNSLGECPPWWGESLTEQEVNCRMEEAAASD